MSFVKSSAERLLVLCGILDRLARSFDADGSRSLEGQRIFQDHFTGDNALFSDSSSQEKHEFRNELTFPHPEISGESLFCTWHGNSVTLRFGYISLGRFAPASRYT